MLNTQTPIQLTITGIPELPNPKENMELFLKVKMLQKVAAFEYADRLEVEENIEDKASDELEGWFGKNAINPSFILLSNLSTAISKNLIKSDPVKESLRVWLSVLFEMSQAVSETKGDKFNFHLKCLFDFFYSLTLANDSGLLDIAIDFAAVTGHTDDWEGMKEMADKYAKGEVSL